jgi:hypothetical protein
VPRMAFPLVLAGMVVVLLVLGGALRNRHAAVACARCGAPACRTCDGRDTDHIHCAPCYSAFVVRGAKVEVSLKIRKDVQIRRYRFRRAWAIRLLSMLWGGSGLLLGGLTTTGALLACLFGILALGGLAVGLLPDMFHVGSGVMLLRLAMLAVPAALVWLVGVAVAFFRVES